jgi:hypothetical protein
MYNNPNWPSRFCQDFITIILCPVFHGKLPLLHHAIRLAMHYRLQPEAMPSIEIWTEATAPIPIPTQVRRCCPRSLELNVSLVLHIRISHISYLISRIPYIKPLIGEMLGHSPGRILRPAKRRVPVRRRLQCSDRRWSFGFLEIHRRCCCANPKRKD